ncbi:hypothetical protein ACEWY4_006792 [Coilia grayii]|uniref:G-protein coupled receptors family 1 profile domain-containing protein n=1 Tax=Coilia grayii TaxID=363190 RepID=A0ABD1KEF5_9TELE
MCKDYFTTISLTILFKHQHKNICLNGVLGCFDKHSEGFSGCYEQLLVSTEAFFLLGTLSLVERIMVVVAVVKNRKLHLPIYFFLCSLAMADMLAVATIVMVLLTGRGLNVHGKLVESMDNLFDFMICIRSLLKVAVDCHITIFYALHYSAVLTRQRVIALVACICAFCTPSGILFIVCSESTAVLVLLILMFFAMLVLMASLYVLVHVPGMATPQEHRRYGSARHPVWHATNIKGAVTLTILLGVFLVRWAAPFFHHLILMIPCPRNLHCACFMSHFNIFLILIMCNTVIDPRIYAFCSQEMRRTFKDTFCCWTAIFAVYL